MGNCFQAGPRDPISIVKRCHVTKYRQKKKKRITFYRFLHLAENLFLSQNNAEIFALHSIFSPPLHVLSNCSP